MRAWKTILAVALCFLLLVSCGGPALITTPAKDMNLTVEQVGSGYSVTEDLGMEGLTSSLNITDTADVSDASLRTFQGEGSSFVLSVIMTTKALATQEMLKDLTGEFEKGFTGSMPGVTLQEFKAPAIGDEAVVRGVEFADLGFSLYFLGFRKANVLGLLAVVGTADTASEEAIVQLGQKLAGKIK